MKAKSVKSIVERMEKEEWSTNFILKLYRETKSKEHRLAARQVLKSRGEPIPTLPKYIPPEIKAAYTAQREAMGMNRAFRRWGF